MSDYIPSYLLLVPGPWQRPQDVVTALQGSGIDVTVAGDAAFAAGSVEVDVVEDLGLGSAVARLDGRAAGCAGGAPRGHERVVDGATAIALELDHAIALERSRGYADIEPRLAWSQWQIVRRTA